MYILKFQILLRLQKHLIMKKIPQDTHTINYNSPLTNYQLNIPEVFIADDGMSASINIQPESDTKIDSLIAPFVMVDYLIKT